MTPLTFIGEIFGELGTIASAAGTFFIGLFTSVAGLFWNSTDGLTVVGSLGLLGLGFGLFKFGFGYVRKLIHMKG